MLKKVSPLADYRLLLTFEGGEKRVFDVTPWLNKGIFRALRDDALFQTAKRSFDTVEWGNGADLCPEILYAKSQPFVAKKHMAVAEERPKYDSKRAQKTGKK
ncbi:MAG TPA: DUF2442 domain-containing protein [Verrucomicrobia bacterium]|nr:DUF2442 domain-containing protein [Verrucomicrobiota bacterium]